MQRTKHGVDARVAVTNDDAEVTLRDGRAETVGLMGGLDEEGQRQLAVDAWTIGLRALQNAYAQAEEAKLKDVGKTLLEQIDRELRNHVELQEKQIGNVLRTYFNPDDGQVTQRLQAFVSDDGDLARKLKDYVASDQSELAKVLAAQVGEKSVLFKRLSPTDSDGVVKQMEARFQEALDGHHETVARALNPNAPESPVQIFLDTLRKQLKQHDEDREKQLKALTAALDAEDEDSLLNQMRRDVERANRDLMKAINPEDEQSPMAMIKNTLTKLIEKRMDETKELLEDARKRQQVFEKNVESAINRIEKTKEAADRSTHGGLDFEDLVSEFIEEAIGSNGLLHERAGNRVGVIPNCKKGDHVLTFADGHAFEGSRVVVEVKRAGNYTVAKVLEELEEAKKNRGADAGVFVMAASHAPGGYPRFGRYGNDILVQWDPDEESTDAYLHAAVVAAMCLVTRKTRVADQEDIGAVGKVEGKLLKEIQRFDKMEKKTGRIIKSAQDLEDEIRKSKNEVNRIIRDVQKTLQALNIEARDIEEERERPIALDDGSLQRAGNAVRASNGEESVDDDDTNILPDDDTPAWQDHVRATSQPEAIAAYRARRDEEADDDEHDESVADAEDGDYEEL